MPEIQRKNIQVHREALNLEEIIKLREKEAIEKQTKIQLERGQIIRERDAAIEAAKRLEERVRAEMTMREQAEKELMAERTQKIEKILAIEKAHSEQIAKELEALRLAAIPFRSQLEQRPLPFIPMAAAGMPQVADSAAAFREEKKYDNQSPIAAVGIDLAMLQAFLKFVADGQQDQAEALLQRNSALALASGDVTDHANRTFSNITAFQYALWALDWHMWKMILKYLPSEAAKIQAKQVATGSWVEKYGEYFKFQPLLENFQTYNKDAPSWNMDKDKDYWEHKIGGAQRQLPMHVFQEYCNPKRAFEPTPTFTEEEFLRQVDFDISKLGDDFGLYRYNFKECQREHCIAQPCDPPAWRLGDYNALCELANRRIEQRREQLAKLGYCVDMKSCKM
jgi:hypothetical protein